MFLNMFDLIEQPPRAKAWRSFFDVKQKMP